MTTRKAGRPATGIKLARAERAALKAARVALVLSLEDVARRIGIGTSTLFRWEQGTRTVRDARLLAAWRRAVAGVPSANRAPVFEEDSDE